MISLLDEKVSSKMLEVQQEAKSLIEQHGAEAVTQAMANMQDLIEHDDARAAQHWLAVAHEIQRMESHQIN